MKQYVFVPFEQLCSSEDLGVYRSFGIRAVSLVNGVETVEAEISDVSINEAYVSQLAEQFTEQLLSPCHLQDVVVDKLAG